MGEATNTPGTLAACSNRLARRLLTIGENRLALLAVEVQEEAGRLLQALALTLGAAAFGLMAGLTLTAAIVVQLWEYSPGAVLLVLAILHGTAGVYLARRLSRLQSDWRMLSATLEQLRKDRACLEENPN